jgi:hypothetical protein
MKYITFKRLALVTGFWFMNLAPVWAQDVGREENIDLFVWIFLGFCALIVVAQLIPALFLLFGFAKGVKKEKTTMAPLDTATKHEGGGG